MFISVIYGKKNENKICFIFTSFQMILNAAKLLVDLRHVYYNCVRRRKTFVILTQFYRTNVQQNKHIIIKSKLMIIKLYNHINILL